MKETHPDKSDKNGNISVWVRCPDCDYERYIAKNGLGKKAIPGLCYRCSRKAIWGEKSPCWKGGRQILKSGYVERTIQPDDPFYCMSNEGTIFEHRLVMARKLGRIIEPWEIVHHKGTRYPIDSFEDRGDNQEDNLVLVTNEENLQIKQLTLRIRELERQVIRRDTVIGQLQSQLKGVYYNR